MDLRTAFKIALLEKDLEQVDLAIDLGITPQAVSDWLNEERIPKRHWEYIRRTLGLEPSDFTGNKNQGHTITQHGHTSQASGRNFSPIGQNFGSPGQIINGAQLNAMETELIDTIRKGNLSDWAKISVILEDIKSRGQI